jgi:hypothetical protein
MKLGCFCYNQKMLYDYFNQNNAVDVASVQHVTTLSHSKLYDDSSIHVCTWAKMPAFQSEHRIY